MALLGIDIGGTKLAAAVFTEEGEIISRDLTLLGERGGKDAGALVADTSQKICSTSSRMTETGLNR